MAKQKLITIQSRDEEKNLKEINKKILELKKEFRKHTCNHIGHLYEVLSKIVKLRQYENKNYAPRSLEWEDDINLTAMQIRYIFSYQYISSYTEKKVKQGLITDSAICHFLSISSLLRESQWQNRLVDKIIKEEIKISYVSELREEELKLFLLGKLKMRLDDEYFISATKTLRSMSKRIEERKHLIEKSPYGDNLLNAIKNLEETIK